MTRWVVEWVEEIPQKMLLCVWHVCCGLHKKYDFCGHLWNSAVTKHAGYYSGYVDMIACWIAKNHDAQNGMTGNLAWSCALGPGRDWTHAFIFSPIFVTAGRVRTQVISVSDHFPVEEGKPLNPQRGICYSVMNKSVTASQQGGRRKHDIHLGSFRKQLVTHVCLCSTPIHVPCVHPSKRRLVGWRLARTLLDMKFASLPRVNLVTSPPPSWEQFS